MSMSEVDSRLDYEELTKIENEQNWKFIRLLIGLSVGILAFSMETYEGNVEYGWIIKISWILLLISFIFGMLNLRYFQKILSRKTKRKKIIEEEKDQTEKAKLDDYRKDIIKFERRNRGVSHVLRWSFTFGIIAFVVYKFLTV